MKMKWLAICVACLLFTACDNPDTDAPANNTGAETAEHADDEHDGDGETDDDASAENEEAEAEDDNSFDPNG